MDQPVLFVHLLDGCFIVSYIQMFPPHRYPTLYTHFFKRKLNISYSEFIKKTSFNMGFHPKP